MTDEPHNRVPPMKHTNINVGDDYGAKPEQFEPVEPVEGWRFNTHARGLSWPFMGALVAGFLLAFVIGWLMS